MRRRFLSALYAAIAALGFVALWIGFQGMMEWLL
jgi:hypothetical protein